MDKIQAYFDVIFVYDKESTHPLPIIPIGFWTQQKKKINKYINQQIRK